MSGRIPHMGLQELVDRYRTLLITISEKEDKFSTIVYKDGNKVFEGEDNIAILSVAQAIQFIINLVRQGELDEDVELSSEELTKTMEIYDQEGYIDKFISSELENTIKRA